ncbi:MAG TPA: VTT domain-containing protein [Bryobacteraceae bacterium]|nr:VTT domain-containing protein [Bryobacteraceae bacterium]
MKKLFATLVSLGPGGLFVMAILDGAGLPIPGGVDAVLVLLSDKLPQSVASLVLCAIAGSTLGNLFLFWLARKGGETYLEKHTLSPAGARFRLWFQHYGLLTVFIAALVPLPVMPMKIFVVCSGALGSNLWGFAGTFVLARVIRYSALGYLGYKMGDNALSYLRLHVWDLVVLAATLLVFLVLLVKFTDFLKARAAKTQDDAG